KIDLLEVLAGRHDREQHIDAGEVGKLVGHLAAFGGQRLGLRPGPVPDRDVIAGLQQALRHGGAHAAHADPADLLLVLRHTGLLLTRTCACHYDTRRPASTVMRVMAWRAPTADGSRPSSEPRQTRWRAWAATGN